MINPKDILLAKEYKLGTGIDVFQYVVTEKYDGVRAIWDGTKLMTRHGRFINAPTWFTNFFPETPLDGELWVDYGYFDEASATIRRTKPINDEWVNIRYMVFDDLSDKVSVFKERLHNLHENHRTWSPMRGLSPSPIIVAQPYYPVNEEELLNLLDSVVSKGGEGLMLRHEFSEHPKGRSSELLKLKKTSDAEATVVGYENGKGKYEGYVGALYVQSSDGRVFKVGSGLTDEMRCNPPTLGTVITYKYRDLTKTGLPRFATFYRLYKEI